MFSAPLRFLCQSDPVAGYGTYDWTHTMTPAGSMFMMLLIVVVFFLVIHMFRRSSHASEAPLDILKRRHAQAGSPARTSSA